MHNLPLIEDVQQMTRRHFFADSASGIGGVALSTLLGSSVGNSVRASAIIRRQLGACIYRK
jgi:hypothetical protein